MTPSVSRIIVYVKNIEKVAAFYQLHFGMKQHGVRHDGWLELASNGSGCTIALHQAAKSQRSGTAIKIVFGVKDVAGFKAERGKHGLVFGPIHKAEGFKYANAKDPAGNSISISSRGIN
jgi:predicted enzyme related to lactoylglutathione lyase